jgi:hypothetical protein
VPKIEWRINVKVQLTTKKVTKQKKVWNQKKGIYEKKPYAETRILGASIRMTSADNYNETHFVKNLVTVLNQEFERFTITRKGQLTVF